MLGAVKLNLGCGSVIFPNWENCDLTHLGDNTYTNTAERTRVFHCDIRNPPIGTEGRYRYIFCNHMLSCFSHHQLNEVLDNIRWMLQPGGKVHILVPDARKAIDALLVGDGDWFPLGDDLPSVDERFCTFLPWFGESLSIFTADYLLGLGHKAGFSLCEQVDWGLDEHDDREREALVVEFTR